jgi:PAS domain S-box-containing protein
MLWIGASLAVVTVLSTYLSIEERRSALTSNLRLRLAEASSQEAVAVSDALWKLNREGTDVVLQGVAGDPDFLAVRVFDETGRIFASVGPTDTRIAAAEHSEVPIFIKQGDIERSIGTLSLYFSHARLEAMQREFLWQATTLGLFQLMAVLLATALALRAVVKPMEAITNRMLAVAGGDLTSPIPFWRRPDQLGNIARAVEVFAREMGARREATRQLELAQEHLERRIEDRTRDLRDSEERFRNLFHNSPLPKWVYNTASLRFMEVNGAAIATYGYSRDEFLSMTLSDIRPVEDIERLMRSTQQLSFDRSPPREWRHRYHDGRIVDVEVYSHEIQLASEVARVAVIIDITARKNAEQQAQRIFETSHDVILVTTGYGDLTQVSPSSATALGYRPEEMVGRNAADFIHSDDLEATRQGMRAARKGQAIRSFRCRYLHKDGHTVALAWVAVWSERDRHYFFFGRDMTDYERTEEQLRQAQKMEAVGQLTGGMAHDFNNMLMVVMAGVEDIGDREGLDPEIQDRIKMICGAIERAAALTRQLLAFSRKQPLRSQPTRVNELIGTTSNLLRRTLGERIEIVTELGQDLYSIDIDRAQLEAALINIGINARDAMPSGGRLLIETRNVTIDTDYTLQNPQVAIGNHVVITMTDNGTGMPRHVVEKVFEPFFTTKGSGKGTGLGLSMVYGFMKQSGGHINVYSELGVGTSIKLYFRASAGQAEEIEAEGTPLARGSGERILVVENDPDVRTTVIRQLRDLGYVAEESADGAAGLAAFEVASPPYDLLLTDVIMPGSMDGPALAVEVRRRWPGTKILFMSGYTGSAVNQNELLPRGSSLLNKPFRKAELAHVVSKAINRT